MLVEFLSMFKFQSLLQRNTRWISQSLLGNCEDALTFLLRPSSIWQRNVCHILDGLQKVRAAGVASTDISSSRARESLRQLQALSVRGCHLSAREMESLKANLPKQLWELNQKEAYLALYHPFVVAMAAGSLPLESFREYIAQDVFYLAAFAEAYGLAIDNTDDQQAKDVLRRLQHHVYEELDQVHSSAMQSFGVELPSQIEPNAATTAYTKFLLAVAKGDFRSQWTPHMSDHSAYEELEVSERKVRREGKLAAFTVGALTPCMRLYAFLGHEIKRTSLCGLKPNPYVKWVETYASADFEAASLESENLLQKLALPFSGEQDHENMKKLYHRAMELEVDFFAAQPLSNKSIIPLLNSCCAANTHIILVSDFDLTCTVEDSCSVLAQLVMSMAHGANTRHLEDKWAALGTQYSIEYKALLDRLLPRLQEPVEQYNPQELRRVLQVLSDFEREANARVVQSEFLVGLKMEEVKQAGSRMAFHQGCEHVLTRVSEVEQSLEIHILSVCWSQSLIQGSFCGKGLEFVNIHSNELQFNNLHLSDGSIHRRIESAVDKEKELERILSQAEHTSSQNQKSLSVYIGDSVTDLLCLLRADVGIVMGESSSLGRMAAAFGIKMLPLYTGLLKREQQQSNQAYAESVPRNLWNKFDGVLYTVSNWNELNAFLLGS